MCAGDAHGSPERRRVHFEGKAIAHRNRRLCKAAGGRVLLCGQNRLYRGAVEEQRRGEFIYQTPALWKNAEYEHAPVFFEDTGDEKTNERNRSLFEGLAVMEDGPAILGQMGRRPVISLSLKSAKPPDWELAYACIREEIAREYKRHLKAADSIVLAGDRQRFLDLADRRGSREDEVTALRFLSECLYQASGEKVVILIDEYDVPLENAYFGRFYERMSAFIRSLFESALKTNPALEFAVVTGCLRLF